MTIQQPILPIRRKVLRLLTYGLFWSWNIIFCIVALFLLVPYVVVNLVNDAIIGAGTWGQAGYAILVVAIPTLTIILGLTRFRKNPSMLMKLFYGFEMPVVFLILMRIMLLRDMNPGMVHLLFNIFIAITAYFGLIYFSNERKGFIFNKPIIRVLLATITLMTGGYLVALILPFVIPLSANFIATLAEIPWLEVVTEFFLYPAFILAFLLGIYTFSLFVWLPFAMAYLYIKQFLKEWFIAKSKLGNGIISMAVVSLIALNIGIFVVVNQQSQANVFKELALLSDNEPLSIEQVNYFVEEKENIRAALVNAYLGAYRYISTQDKSNAVLAAYKEAFDSPDNVLAKTSQAFFNTVASPFLYDGEDFRANKAKATRLYQRLFDTPIEKAEKQAIIAAVQATWEREEMAAGLINAANQHVLVTEQQIHIKAKDDTALINIVQRLENQTFNRHEVAMHFALPEEAVLTGLWLSDDENLPRKYPFVVAPRGAAQQVYNDEVKRRVDPSLLEKVGPRQYRLRAFPVLAKNCDYNSKLFYIRNNCKSDPLFVELEYVTTANSNGSWPLPELLEQRNLYWNSNLKLSLNSQPLVRGEAWLPQSIYFEADNMQRNTMQRQSMQTVIGDTIITAIPRKKQDETKPVNYSDLTVGVLIDSSYSMGSKKQALDKAIAWLASNNINYQLYRCRDACQSIPSMESNELFLDNQQPLQQLRLWNTSFDLNQHNMLIMLTDRGSYELEKGNAELASNSSQFIPPAPLWLVHLNGELPYAYHDDMLELLKKGQGGIAGSIQEAFTKQLFRQQYAAGVNNNLEQTMVEQAMPFAMTDNYLWFASTADVSSIEQSSEFFTKLASKQWLEHLSKQQDTSRLAILDNLHTIAKENNIVTDYSSMLVLVNDRQKQALKEAEAKGDRFDREVETGREDITTPTDMFSVQAVPEPEEWILIGLVSLMLGIAYYRRRQGQSLYPRLAV